MSLKPRKKGGCYGSVSDNYMLLENAINQVKTSGGCREFADVKSSYMLTETKGAGKTNKIKKGGDLLSMGNDLLQKTTDLLNQQQKQGGCGCSSRKGGAVELAPFAAAVALMAARVMVPKLEKSSLSPSKTSSRRKRTSKNA